jgi:hypothetical protein
VDAETAHSARDTRARIPPWEPAATRLLRGIAGRIHLIASATPTNLSAELARLEGAFARGEEQEPRFAYEPAAPPAELETALARSADALEGQGPLAELYAARARELRLEARLCAAVGGPTFRSLAGLRYSRRDEHDAAADCLCERWLGWAEALREGGAREALTSTDDAADPHSLVCALGRAIGALGLPVRLSVTDRLSALAATGAGVIYVARGRRLRRRDVARTVVHEIHGHALPRERALATALGIFALGTAWGADDQEGRAILLERDASLLDHERRTELARRHRAARGVEHGECFVETVRALRATGADLSDALRVAARAHRGSGLGRERVYLPALLRVAAARGDPRVERALAAGKVAVDAAPELAPFVSGVIPTSHQAPALRCRLARSLGAESGTVGP